MLIICSRFLFALVINLDFGIVAPFHAGNTVYGDINVSLHYILYHTLMFMSSMLCVYHDYYFYSVNIVIKEKAHSLSHALKFLL